MADFKKEILAVLQSIQSTGAFVTNGTVPFDFPGIVVRGVGEMGFPVPAVQTQQLISRAHRAPFGKGTQTVVNKKVRSGWQIDTGDVSFDNGRWNPFLKSVLDKAKAGLGIQDRQVSAKFYKLLIYEPGDFFLPHKDSEKEPGMFATLILGLPSDHEGGKLIVHFDGTTSMIDFADPSKKYEIPYAAFYADCLHEIKPVTSGYRLCLVYNLVMQGKGHKPDAPLLGGTINKLAAVLKKVEEDNDIPKVILLGHQYTPSNFTMDALKLNDRARAEVLLRAAEQAGFFAKPGLVTSYQIGELTEEYDNSSSYRSRGRGRYDDDDDEECADDDNQQNANDVEMMGEVFDESVEIKYWMPGGIPPLANLEVQLEDLISPVELNEGKPTEKNTTGYTGNAGMEMEYWYHYGAIFLWPRKYHYDLLRIQPAGNLLEWIAYYNSQQPGNEKSANSVVKKIVEHALRIPDDGQDVNGDPLAEWIIRIDDEKYLARHAEKKLKDYFEWISVENWVRLFQKYPDYSFLLALTAASKGNLKKIAHLLAILEGLHSVKDPFDRVIKAQMEKLPAYLNAAELTYLTSEEQARVILSKSLSLSAIVSMSNAWLINTTHAVTRQMNRNFVNKVLIAVLLEAGNPSKLADQLLKHALDNLQGRVNQKPQPPSDWSRALPLEKSFDREAWKILAPFLRSPVERIFDYRKGQAERSDMEHAIRRVTIDLKMETIRKGSPHTLRIIKTQAAYEKQVKEWNEDVKILKRVSKWA